MCAEGRRLCGNVLLYILGAVFLCGSYGKKPGVQNKFLCRTIELTGFVDLMLDNMINTMLKILARKLSDKDNCVRASVRVCVSDYVNLYGVYLMNHQKHYEEQCLKPQLEVYQPVQE